MKMISRLPAMAFVLLLSLMIAQAAAAAPKTFVVMPFSINAPQSYAYLAKAVPATIQGKLNNPGVLSGRSGTAKVSSPAEARKALSGADYAVWGSVSVMGSEATITMNSVDRAGKTWSRTQQAPLSALTSTLQGMCAALGSEAMGVSVAQGGGMRTPGQVSHGPRAAHGNNDIIVNDSGQNQSQYYLNPQFRYQGAGANDGSRMRSQRLNSKMVDMAVGDFNGDGKNEIAVCDDHHLYMYVWGSDGRLRPLGETTVMQGNNNFSMRAMDLNHDGAMDLVIATFDESNNRPYSFFFSFKGNKFSQCAERCPYFASVMRVPPTYAPTLVGQNWDSLKLFAPGVHMMVKTGNKYTLGGRISLPSGATVFNTCWLRGGKSGGGDLTVMLRDDERLRLYSAKGSLVHTTMERYSGSAVDMDHYKGMPGMGIDKTYQLPSKYYAPMRFISTDLGHTGEPVLIINKPISTAAQFFDRYRYFPQGEIHALFWDGVGLGLKWKTRRIRGSVAEVDLADVNNDGVLDLVVGLNTSPDLGIGSRQSMVTAYPLDVSATNPDLPADISDFEVNPNR